MFQSAPPVKAATHHVFQLTQYGEFQSAPPVKAATAHDARSGERGHVSIRAAREGGDRSSGRGGRPFRSFNPRRP